MKPNRRSLDHALRLRSMGLSVIPVPRAGRTLDGKTPIIRWKAFQERLSTEDEIRSWFATDHNIAIITGALSGVVVIDIDSPEARRWMLRRLPYTPWQTETQRGFHLYYRHPGVRVPNRARLATDSGRREIDVRGDGGYVIAPGSVHASGAAYREAGDWTVPRQQLPRFWLGWIARPTRETPQPTRPRPTGDVMDRARRYLSAVPVPEIGQGSDVATLSAACRLVRGFAIPEAHAAALLWEWAGGRPGWTFGWVARKVQHAIRYGTEPAGALR